MPCKADNHKKGCNCGFGSKRKPSVSQSNREESVHVKTVNQESAVKPVGQVQSSASVVVPADQGQVSANQQSVPAVEVKTIGQPDSPVKQAREQSELDRLMGQLNTGNLKPPDAPVDKTAPVNPVKPVNQEVKPPAPDLPVSGVADSNKMLGLMAKLSKYRPEDMPLIVTSMSKSPFETLNAIKRTGRFSLTEKEAQGLAVQMIQCAEMFGWDVVNKWVMLFGLVSSVIILGAEKWRLPEPAAKQTREETKSDVKQSAENAGGPGPGATGEPAKQPGFKVVRLV